MPAQQCPKLLLGRDRPMMLLLTQDVGADLRNLGLAYGEGSISNLPGKPSGLAGPLVHPFRGVCLQELEHLGDCHVGTYSGQEMHVVRHASGHEEDAALTPQDAPEISV